METPKTYYANGLTIVLNRAEGILRFMKNTPVFGDEGEVKGEALEDEYKVIVPREMLQDLPRIITEIFENEQSEVRSAD